MNVYAIQEVVRVVLGKVERKAELVQEYLQKFVHTFSEVNKCPEYDLEGLVLVQFHGTQQVLEQIALLQVAHQEKVMVAVLQVDQHEEVRTRKQLQLVLGVCQLALQANELVLELFQPLRLTWCWNNFGCPLNDRICWLLSQFVCLMCRFCGQTLRCRKLSVKMSINHIKFHEFLNEIHVIHI